MIIRDKDVDLSLIRDKQVAVIGYGSQGEAQAKNLRDSGMNVCIGVRNGASQEKASLSNFDVKSIEDAVSDADIIALLTPERSHKEIIELIINLKSMNDAIIVFAHGYTVRFAVAEIRQDIGMLLVAPKAIGPQLRHLYKIGEGAPALVAAINSDLKIAVAYAAALGCGRKAIIPSTFEEETETDLFGEQVVLCGGIPALAIAAFETLVNRGYSKEAAYFECLYEIKLIADMMVEHGIMGMVNRISDTAQFGAMSAGKRIVSQEAITQMQLLLDEIQSGKFSKLFEEEQSSDFAQVKEWKQSLRKNAIDSVKFD